MDDKLVYLCMTDEDFPRRIPFAFLEDIKQRFKAAYGDRGKRALAYEMNEDFKKVLQKQAVCLSLAFSLHRFIHCLRRNTLQQIRVQIALAG